MSIVRSATLYLAMRRALALVVRSRTALNALRVQPQISLTSCVCPIQSRATEWWGWC